MHIAYISYEYPPDTAVGGIATYVWQVSNIMHERGHEVEVFCASEIRTGSEKADGVLIHRLLCRDRVSFSDMILPVFEAANRRRAFDIVESPEFSGDALAVKRNFPAIPLVVKLHTPWFLIGELNVSYLRLIDKLKYMASGLVRGKIHNAYWKPRKKEGDPDYMITCLADQIHSPSISLGEIVADRWKIARTTMSLVPNPYSPGPELLNIPFSTATGVITYVGRLEVRKGLIELGKAIPLVLKSCPSVKFRFVGSVQHSPVKGLNMKEYLLTRFKSCKDHMEFLEVPANRIAEIYAETDICVFPSLWENFPNTCLEAMSAARGIVASSQGGMLDMLGDCDGGILIDPKKYREIADALILLVNDKGVREQKGQNARRKVLSSYGPDAIGTLIERKYRELVNDIIDRQP